MFIVTFYCQEREKESVSFSLPHLLANGSRTSGDRMLLSIPSHLAEENSADRKAQQVCDAYGEFGEIQENNPRS